LTTNGNQVSDLQWYFWFAVGALYGVLNVSLLALSFVGLVSNNAFDSVRQAARRLAMAVAGCAAVLLVPYAMEACAAWDAGDTVERWVYHNRVFGPNGWVYWLVLFGECFLPQLLWFQRIRNRPGAKVVIAIGTLVAMAFNSWVIRMTLDRENLPTTWGEF